MLPRTMMDDQWLAPMDHLLSLENALALHESWQCGLMGSPSQPCHVTWRSQRDLLHSERNQKTRATRESPIEMPGISLQMVTGTTRFGI